MKKILYTSALLGGLLFGNSCSDYLEEENISSATAENYYVTQGGYETLINSAYSTLRSVYGPTPYLFSAGTDLFFGAHQDVPLALTTYETLTPGNPQVGDFFQTLYESIQVQNTALHYAELTEDFPQLESRKGEARFLRAFYYFLLVQSFGDVTLVTEMVDAPITHFERDPAADVYQFIIDELEMAIEELPATQSDYGRVTQRAAQHMLAKVYLTRGYESYGEGTADFTQAAILADAAIGGQELNISYLELFGKGNEVNEEVLFAVQYDEASLINGGAHNWDTPWGPLIQGVGEGVQKKNMLHPTEYLFKVYGEYDNRFEGTFMNVRTTPYVGYYLDPSNALVVTYFPRTQEEIANVDAWRAESPTRSRARAVPIGPSWWEATSQIYPSLSKFDRIQNSDVRFTHDLYVARLGETYLIAAEAYFKSGDIGTAVNRINEVRTRAAMEGHESDMLITEADLGIEFILDERARELAGEGHRFFDLKRTGKLVERTIAHNPQIDSENLFRGNNGALKILRPIPLRAISLDEGEYPQNPAYAAEE